MAVCKCVYGKVARSLIRYGERQRPEHRSGGFLIDAQVADAPRTVPLSVPYTHLQTDLISHLLAPMQNRCFSPRINNFPSAIAIEVRQGSPIEFVPSTSCCGPALITKVSPSSLVSRILPSYATGDAP